MDNLTPKQIVDELDKHIIGQKNAKKAVAISLRNRWRRMRVEQPLRDEIVPKNILMVGPTGVGKTEIARRLAKLAEAPFIKVEATKFTEIGYVGRDVESIIRDLTEQAVNMKRDEKHKQVKEQATIVARKRLLISLVGKDASTDTIKKYDEKLINGELDDKDVDIDVTDNSSPMTNFDVPGMPGSQMGLLNVSDMIGKAFGNKTKNKRMNVKKAMEIIISEEAEKLSDQESIASEALRLVEQSGIVFLDEIDKVTHRSDMRGGEVNREGVQRDLLPLLEGTTVNTKHGIVKTDHILFIASGAFHMSKPSDLLPELQGRIPIRVELRPLTEEDFVAILTEPEASLIKQYIALMKTENLDLSFTKGAIKSIAHLAAKFNSEVENIGARRLHTVMEKLIEDLSFNADNLEGKHEISEEEVKEKIGELAEKNDLSKFIL